MRQIAQLVLVAALGGAPAAFAQSYPTSSDSGDPGPMRPRQFDVSAFAGYQLNGDASTSGGTLVIDDAPAFGAALDWRLPTAGAIELMWAYTKPNATFNSINPFYPSSSSFKVPTHYFQLGGMLMRQVDRVEGFFGLTLGAVLLLPETIDLSTGGTTQVSSTWRFAASLMAGTKIWVTPNFGLRLEARMLMPILFNNAGYYTGSGGSGLAATAGIPSLQFAFSGGLIFGR
jgi:hypothetical protein